MLRLVSKLRKFLATEIDVDSYWPTDERLKQVSFEIPSTRRGRELMTTVWPQRYPGLISSATYRGCVTVLLALHANLRRVESHSELKRIIELVDNSLKRSSKFSRDADGRGGAVLVSTNIAAAARSGRSVPQVIEEIESEKIYAAQKFIEARQAESSGAKLS